MPTSVQGPVSGPPATQCDSLPFIAAQPWPEVVARVNDRAITRAALVIRLLQSRAANPALFDDAYDAAGPEAAQLIVRAMVSRELQLQEAQRLAVSVSEADVERELAALCRRFGGEAALEQTLNEAAITAAQWREEARRNRLIAALERSLAQLCSVSAEDLADERRRRDGHGTAAELRAAAQQRRWARSKAEWMRSLECQFRIWYATPPPSTAGRQ